MQWQCNKLKNAYLQASKDALHGQLAKPFTAINFVSIDNGAGRK